MKDPQTPEQWRMAAAMAQACIVLDAARQYGLVTGGPGVNLNRCLEVVARAKARDIVPSEAEIDQAIQAIVIAHGGESADV